MIDRLGTISSVIDDHAIAGVSNALLLRYSPGYDHQMTQQLQHKGTMLPNYVMLTTQINICCKEYHLIIIIAKPITLINTKKDKTTT